MRFQALLLSLVILISLLLGSSKNMVSKETNEIVLESKPTSHINQELETDDSFSIFLKDFYSILLEKISLAGQDLFSVVVILSEKTNLVSRDLAFIAANLGENFNKNLVATKEIFSRSLEFNNENDRPDKSYESYPSTYALVSKTKINPQEIFPCKPDQSILAGFTSKAILIKYLDFPMGSNQVIFELNPEKRWPIASLVKLMTSLVAIENMDLDKEIIMTEKAVATEGIAGEFKNGEVFKLRDLIKAMLISSSNDAAIAIAENFGERDFVDEMQKKAAKLQMFSTTYLEPSGLSFINQSTINDLAKLMGYIYFNHPEILEISRQKEAGILELKTGKARKILTVNKFAGEANFIGGKTGYIEEAGRNLVSLFNLNGKTILTIVLGAEDSFKETEELKSFVRNCQQPMPVYK